MYLKKKKSLDEITRKEKEEPINDGMPVIGRS